MTYCFDAEIIGPWVNAACGWPWVPHSASAIGKISNDRIVGGITYEKYNGACVTMHVAGEGNWLDRNLLWMAFDYPFRQLKVKRLLAMIPSANAKSRKFVERLGFEQEAVLSDAYPDADLIVFKMTADKCRWLKEK